MTARIYQMPRLEARERRGRTAPDLYDTFAANDDHAELTGESAVGIFIAACIVNAVAWLARNSLAIALGLFVGMMATVGLAYVWSLFL